jgi:hypothetical protein
VTLVVWTSDLANKALSESERFSNQTPRTDAQTLILANAWSILSVTQARLGLVDQGKQSATKSMALWAGIDKPGLLVPYRQIMNDTQALLTPQYP